MAEPRKTDNIPPEWQAIVASAIARSLDRQALASKTKAVLVKEVYAEIVRQFSISGVNEDEISPSIHAYLSKGLSTRVVAYAMAYAEKNLPSHRKGYGEEFKEEIPFPNDILFRFDGTGNGDWPDGPGGGYPPPDEGGGDGEEGPIPFEFAPSSEIDRAKAALQFIASETGFGRGSNALEFVRAVARYLGGNWGLNGKRGDPNNLSSDVLAWKIPGYVPQTFDVIGDSGGQNKITWQNLPYTGKGAVWVEP